MCKRVVFIYGGALTPLPADPAYSSLTGQTRSMVVDKLLNFPLFPDRSGSMGSRDRQPLPNVPATDLIRRHSDNRLGAVYSSLHSFWIARHSASTAGQQANPGRRDSYSVILFHSNAANSITNDFTSTPDELLSAVLPFRAGGSTNFTAALEAAQNVMETNWSTER